MMKRYLKAFGLLFLQIFLLVPTCMSGKSEKPIKSADQYWFETGLGSTELEALLSDQSCLGNEMKFISCANAILSMSSRYNLTLTLEGQLVAMNPGDFEGVKSEKAMLQQWKRQFLVVKQSGGFSFRTKWQELDSRYIQKKERSGVIAQGINGFLSVFKDPHTYIMPVAQYEEVVANSEARQDKLGFIYRKSGSQLVIKKIIEGSPADYAGLQKSDQIIELNGLDISRLLPNQIGEMLRLKESQRLRILVQRQNQKKYFELFKTDKVYPSVTSKVLPGKSKLGLLMLHKFTKDVCKQAKQKLVGLMEEGIKGILLDVRDNPGGQLDEAACIANIFVKKGTLLFETKYLDATKLGDSYIADETPIYSGPMTVLINSGSASASEILAGSLKDLGRASLVGERSFGKGSFQDGHLWGSNKKIALFQTEGLYYFPSGWTPQLVGLQPDIPVAFNNSESQSESELYFNPLKPKDAWTGPQTLSWLQQFECETKKMGSVDANDLSISDSGDLQIDEARSWLSCRGQSETNGFSREGGQQ